MPARSRVRLATLGAAGALLAGGLIATPAAHAADSDRIASPELTVEVSTTFPQALRYTRGGKSLTGAAAPTGTLRVNGTDYRPTVRGSKASESRYSYVLDVPEIRGLRLWADLEVQGSAVEFRVTRIADPRAAVKTLQIPDQDLVTVTSNDPGATVASSVISVDRAKSGDTIEKITAATPADPNPKNSRLAIAHTDQLAAAVESNSLHEGNNPSNESGKLLRRAVRTAEQVRMGVSSGQWLYRATGSPTTEPLPWARVAITDDANRDSRVDWQDGAIAYRSIQVRPVLAEDVKNRVVTHIPFNFASQATHPFTRTLDDVKRISRATDGLGQMVLEKGYTSEGHDSANSDYGGNFNQRAGGLADFNTLLREGKKFGATFSVHVNATEAYPEANSFNDEFVTNGKGWDWLDQSWYINQQRDINTGTQKSRWDQLAREADDNLTALYVDVFYSSGWVSRRTQQNLIDAGFGVMSEWSYSMSENNTWSHWANDENYGGASNKGINSQITRFVDNSNRDTWNPHPLLGTTHIVEFEGWQGKTDYTGFVKNIFANNLPVKYLQARDIMRWEDNRISFADGVEVSGTSAQDRVISTGGVPVLRGGSYLLPWASEPVEFGHGAKNDPTPRKLYHYNATGGQTTWQLTPEFRGARMMQVYKLTDDGRQQLRPVPVSRGSVTIDAEPGQAYVLVPDASVTTVPTDVDYGAGSPVSDPGFNTAGLPAWAPQGGAQQTTIGRGLRVAQLGSAASSISQQLKPLPQTGTYSVSAWVEIERGKSRPTTLRVEGASGGPAEFTAGSSTLRNAVAADQKNNTYFQRMRVLVDAKAGERPKVSVSAPAGGAVVRVDDVRVVRTERVPSAGVLSEDFEHTDQGWWPFVKGNAGGINDPRTHIAKRHEPYTQKGWRGSTTSDVLAGDFSLHSHKENEGTVYRTTNHTLPMTPGHKYRVSFDYQSSTSDGYAWVGGYDFGGNQYITASTPIPTATETTRFAQEVSASTCGPGWVGLQRTAADSAPEFSLDNLLVEDLGPAGEIAGCAGVELAVAGDLDAGDNEVTTTLVNREPAAIRNAEVTLQLPDGWTATPLTPATIAELAPGASFQTRWRVTVPEGTTGRHRIGATARYTTTVDPVGERTVRGDLEVKMAPQPPTGDAYLSDLDWVGEPQNGWGPPERDRANGETGPNDGPPITLGGKTYTKGIGAHANSLIRYRLGGRCTSFTATVGVDGKQGTAGSVQFFVFGDDKELARTEVLRGGQAPVDLNVNVTGVDYLDIAVGDGGNGAGNDWADWADARVRCS